MWLLVSWYYSWQDHIPCVRKAEVHSILCMMIELGPSEQSHHQSGPGLAFFTSHLEMKHHHVFIIKHSHSHIATHEDVSGPNLDQITGKARHFKF